MSRRVFFIQFFKGGLRTLELKAHEKFRLIRQRKGLTQDGLAQKLNISQMHVSRIERGISTPPEDLSKLIEKELKERIWVKGEEKSD